MAPQAESLVTTIRRMMVAPPPTSTPAIIYIPEIHAQRYGRYFPELRTGDTAKAAIVADICSAQHDEVVRIIAIDLAAGTSWDASKEIAQAVLDQVLSESGEIPHHCRNFLEEHLGVRDVMDAEREAA